MRTEYIVSNILKYKHTLKAKPPFSWSLVLLDVQNGSKMKLQFLLKDLQTKGFHPQIYVG